MCKARKNDHISSRHNTFSYFFRRRLKEDYQRKNFYISLLDEMAGCDYDVATKFSSVIDVIQNEYHDRLAEWLQHPLERLKLKEAFRYFLMESSAEDNHRCSQILEKLCQHLPQFIIDELIASSQDVAYHPWNYLTTLKRRGSTDWSRTSSIVRLETVV